MNAQEIINSALSAEQETADDFYTTSELYQWLNDGLLEFIDESGIYKAIFPVTMAFEIANYPYPSGLIRPEKTFYDTVMGELESADVSKLSEVFPGWRGESGGTPEYFYEELPGYVSVYPKPDSANAGKILTILGVSEHPTVTSSSTVIVLSKVYHQPLVEYLLYRMKTKDDRNSPDGLTHYKLFKNFIIKARTDARQANRKDKRYSFFPSNIKRT
jgi:hypothetical protein